MFGLRAERGRIGGVISLAAHVAVVVALVAESGGAAPPPPSIVVLPESMLVAPSERHPAPVGPQAPVTDPVPPFTIPDLPEIPGIPPIPGSTIAIPGVPGADTVQRRGPGEFDVWITADVDEPPLLLSAPTPIYPPLLRQAGVQGSVVVRAVVDTFGRAEPASLRVVVSANPGFDGAALACLRRALFRPARIRGRAVRVLVDVPLHFMLRP
jgi:protein TonB